MKRLKDLGLIVVNALTLGMSMKLDVARKERGERKFFATHDYQDQLARYDAGIDKILLVNSVNSVMDFDARKVEAIILDSPRMNPLQGVWAKERNTAIYALNHLIDSDRQWMFSFDVPVDTRISDSWGIEVYNPKLPERWVTTLPAPFGQLVRVDYWVAFYRGMHNFFDKHIKELAAGDAFLGFFCKKCDDHYEHDTIEYKVERGHRGPVEMKQCPKGHYV